MRQILYITQPGHPELEVFTALNEPQLYHYCEPSPGLFIAETPNVVRRALDAGYEPVCMLCEESLVRTADEILAGYPDMPVHSCAMDVLKQITGFSLTHGMLCSMRRKTEKDAGELLRQIGRENESAVRIAVLEDVVNPTNAGAIFRSAAGLGMDAVFLTEGCADPLQRRCIRVSMGTVFQIPWAYIGARADSWPEEGMARLRAMGFQTAAMALREDSLPVDAPQLAKADKLALILGTEGDGLADTTIADCGYVVRIPMSHQVDSLNVAAASAVAFWQLGRYS